MARSRLVRNLAIGMLAASIPLMAACAALPGDTGALQGDWVLESGSDADGAFVDSLQPITLVVEGDQVSGQAPCNPFSGPIVRGPGASGIGEIEFGGLTRTEMACADQEQTVLEGRFFLALESADRVSVSDDGERLEFTGDDTFLSFERQG